MLNAQRAYRESRIEPFIDLDTYAQTSSQLAVDVKSCSSECSFATYHKIHQLPAVGLPSSFLFLFSYISIITERAIFRWHISAISMQAAAQLGCEMVYDLVIVTPLNAHKQISLFIHPFSFRLTRPSSA